MARFQSWFNDGLNWILRPVKCLNPAGVPPEATGFLPVKRQIAATFGSSFKVYAIDSTGKLKTFTANISGVAIAGIGYGVETINGRGSCAVVIAEQGTQTKCH